MIYNYKVTVMPYGRPTTVDGYYMDTLEFELLFTDDFDGFIRLWSNNYPDTVITIEPVKKISGEKNQ
jgi:hypothetical protein